MSRYAIWNKTDDIFTLGVDSATGKAHWTAAEYIAAKAPWAANPNVKVIVGGGVVNGTCFMEYASTVEFYKKQGAAIVDGMTDEEILAAIEDFEDNPPSSTEPSTEERTAAALEAIADGQTTENAAAINALLGEEA